MADISKIKTPDGTTYDLKDTTARANSGVTGVKGSAESSYRTGQVNLTAENVDAIAQGQPLFTTNNFTNSIYRNLYISKIDNSFYCANKRYNVSMTIDGVAVADSTLSSAFDGNYETSVIIPSGKTGVITFDFSGLGEAKFPGYPYGYIYISFYYVAKPASLTGRVYNNYAPQTVGWSELTFQRLKYNTDGQHTYVARQSRYGLETLELSIVGMDNGGYSGTRITQIELWLDRPDPSRTPILSKYIPETLYYNLTAPKFIGDLEGVATTADGARHLNKADNVNASTINAFRGATLRYANATGLNDITGLVSGDGIVIWIPWSDSYGRQILFDDNTNNEFLRAYNNGTWTAWRKMNDGGNANKVNSHTVNSDVPANAKFTDTTYTGTSPISINSSNQVSISNASTSAYGATKLSTATNSTATDLAATPSAVKTAYDLANTANGTANTALSGVNGTLIYDHTYSISNGVATFTAHVYQKGVEVTNNYADSCFEWSYKLASAVTGTPSVVSLGTGKTKTITISTLGYGGYVLGTFTPA